MKIFITGTGTDIGKTIVSSWICAHTGYDYFKPIQSGDLDNTDSDKVERLAAVKVHKEIYRFSNPLSPHIASKLENISIDIQKIKLPKSNNLIIEGAGGVLVPINQENYVIDIIKKFASPVIIVASTNLGTINHTLLTIEALRKRSIEILGVIMYGDENIENNLSIANYGKIEILGHLPIVDNLSKNFLLDIPLGSKLNQIFNK